MTGKPGRHTEVGRSNGKVRADKWETLRGAVSGNSPSWAWAGAEDLQDTIAAATEAGVALLFSKTSDGGALSLHVLTGGAAIKLYPTDSAEINEALSRIREVSQE